MMFMLTQLMSPMWYFGKFDIVEDYILINHILLLVKYYIYCRKFHKNIPSIRNFIARARRVFNIKLHIATETNKLLFHFEKWEKPTNALNKSWCTEVRKNARSLSVSRHLYCCCCCCCCNTYFFLSLFFSLLLLSFFFSLLG